MITTRDGIRARARLHTIGAYVPERVMTNADFEQILETCLLYTSDAADE